MTRILYWNIQDFSINKINNPNPVPAAAAAGRTQGQDRLHHIIQEVVVPVDPHIFVVVEVEAGGIAGDKDGEPMKGPKGIRAVLEILNQLRNTLNNNNWCLIPPVNVGGYNPNAIQGIQKYSGLREGVAVYYRSDLLQFKGPYVMSGLNQGNQIPRSQSPNTPNVLNNLANYPAGTWDNIGRESFRGTAIGRNCLIPNPAPAGGNIAVPEQQLAGQYVYYPMPNPAQPLPLPVQQNARTNSERRIDFPGSYNRPPYLTKFTEVNGHGQGRTINLFAVHTSPEYSDRALKNLALVPEINANIQANDVNVIVGDFNVDSFNTVLFGNDSYRDLINLNYDMALSPIAPNARFQDPDRKKYCMTHLLPINVATPYNAIRGTQSPTENVYPRYGYMGTNFPVPNAPHNVGAIDNIFFKYGNPPQAGNNNNITIVNTITGKPYNNANVPVPAGVTAELTGGLVILRTVNNNGLPLPTQEHPSGGYRSPSRALGAFRSWQNFERIRSTSDHLAISIDI